MGPTWVSHMGHIWEPNGSKIGFIWETFGSSQQYSSDIYLPEIDFRPIITSPVYLKDWLGPICAMLCTCMQSICFTHLLVLSQGPTRSLF